MIQNWQKDVCFWHTKNGGKNVRLAGHALRLLNEAVELCLAAGASQTEIRTVVVDKIIEEAAKPHSESSVVDSVAVREEAADVVILATIVGLHTGDPDLGPDVQKKISVLWQRQWAADQDGVLWRPDRLPKEKTC